MSFEIKTVDQCATFLKEIRYKKDLYLADDNGKIQIISQKLFNQLKKEQKETTLTYIPWIIIEQHILDNTSLKEIENAKGINKYFNKPITHETHLLSINNGELCLKKAFPFKTATEAIDWLNKDEKACKFLTYANFEGFNDFDEKNLKQIIESFPNLKHLSISSDALKEIEGLPESLETLTLECRFLKNIKTKLPDTLQDLSLCRIIMEKPFKIPLLPKLKTIKVRSCNVISLEEQPDTLEKIDLYCCYLLESVCEKYSSSLRTLNVKLCHKLKSLGNLPDTLEKLDINNCRLLESVCEKYSTSLRTLNVKLCPKLESLGNLPGKLESLYLENLDSLRVYPELPDTLQDLYLKSILRLGTISKVPPLLKKLVCEYCPNLKSIPKTLPDTLLCLYLYACNLLKFLPEVLPKYLEVLICDQSELLQSLPEKLPSTLKTLSLDNCRSLRSLPEELPESLETLYLRDCITFEKYPKIPKGCTVHK